MPASTREGMTADDERLMPLYELCQDLEVPAFVMSGPTTPDLRLNDPLAVDRVARTFPKLPLVCCHGFYPNVAEMVTVAFRNENVFVSPDMYTFAPGGRPLRRGGERLHEGPVPVRLLVPVPADAARASRISARSACRRTALRRRPLAQRRPDPRAWARWVSWR